MYFTQFLAKFFGLTFWQNLVPTLIGALIGVYIAFWLDHRRSGKQAKEQQRSLYEHLTLALMNNMQIMNSIYEEILPLYETYDRKDITARMTHPLRKTAWFPTQNVDYMTLQAVAFHRYSLIRDVSLNIELDIAQSILAELHRKLEILQTPGISAQAHDKLMDDVKRQLELQLSPNGEIMPLIDKLRSLAGGGLVSDD